jgi:hypothetical protein
MTQRAVAPPRSPSELRMPPTDGMQPLTRLRRSTGDRAALVAMLVRAPLARPSRENERRYLCDLYGFVAAFERELVRVPGLDVPFLRASLRGGMLATQLLALGLTADAHARLARRCVIPVLGGPVEALGWMYVVERVTMTASGREQRRSWSRLARELDNAIDDAHDLGRLLAASSQALDCLEQWMIGIELP